MVDGSAAAYVPAMYPWAVQRPNPCWWKPPADSPPQYNPGMTWPCMAITWHWALMRRPARVSCTFGVAQTAYKGGVWIVYGGWALPKSRSTPASTKALERATVASRVAPSSRRVLHDRVGRGRPHDRPRGARSPPRRPRGAWEPRGFVLPGPHGRLDPMAAGPARSAGLAAVCGVAARELPAPPGSGRRARAAAPARLGQRGRSRPAVARHWYAERLDCCARLDDIKLLPT